MSRQPKRERRSRVFRRATRGWEAVSSVWQHRRATDFRMAERAGTYQEAILKAPERGAQPL